MADNVVYIGGRHEQAEAGDRKALRGALFEVVRSFRKGEIRAALVVTIENDGGMTWRVAGQSSDLEIIAALERTKFDLMMEG